MNAVSSLIVGCMVVLRKHNRKLQDKLHHHKDHDSGISVKHIVAILLTQLLAGWGLAAFIMAT